MIVELLGIVGRTVVEVTVEHAVRSAFEPRAPAAPVSDPVQDAINVMDGFLRAVAARDMDAFTSLCDVEWAMLPETAELMDHTLAAAPPLSWAFKEVLAPEGWVQGRPLPWLVAELAVTFDLGGRYEVIPAVLRTIPTDAGWQVDYLWWGESATPDPNSIDLSRIFGFEPPVFEIPTTAVIDCARCGQKLRVPADKGRLRVTCRRCSNVQWYTP
jgi:hypothetical protein